MYYIYIHYIYIIDSKVPLLGPSLLPTQPDNSESAGDRGHSGAERKGDKPFIAMLSLAHIRCFSNDLLGD
jgi:hypothetical protein